MLSNMMLSIKCMYVLIILPNLLQIKSQVAKNPLKKKGNSTTIQFANKRIDVSKFILTIKGTTHRLPHSHKNKVTNHQTYSNKPNIGKFTKPNKMTGNGAGTGRTILIIPRGDAIGRTSTKPFQPHKFTRNNTKKLKNVEDVKYNIKHKPKEKYFIAKGVRKNNVDKKQKKSDEGGSVITVFFKNIKKWINDENDQEDKTINDEDEDIEKQPHENEDKEAEEEEKELSQFDSAKTNNESTMENEDEITSKLTKYNN